MKKISDKKKRFIGPEYPMIEGFLSEYYPEETKEIETTRHEPATVKLSDGTMVCKTMVHFGGELVHIYWADGKFHIVDWE